MEQTRFDKESFYDYYMEGMRELYDLTKDISERLDGFDGGKTVGISFVLAMMEQIRTEFTYEYGVSSKHDEMLENIEKTYSQDQEYRDITSYMDEE